MREFSDEEIQIYNNFSSANYENRIKPDSINSNTESRDSLHSIQILTRNFLVGLQENFPATIPTIFRTGDKLSVSDDVVTDDSGEKCIICQGKRDAHGTTLEATNFSKLVSCKGKDDFENDINLAVEDIINMDINKISPEKGMAILNFPDIRR